MSTVISLKYNIIIKSLNNSLNNYNLKKDTNLKKELPSSQNPYDHTNKEKLS